MKKRNKCKNGKEKKDEDGKGEVERKRRGKLRKRWKIRENGKGK